MNAGTIARTRDFRQDRSMQMVHQFWNDGKMTGKYLGKTIEHCADTTLPDRFTLTVLIRLTNRCLGFLVLLEGSQPYVWQWKYSLPVVTYAHLSPHPLNNVVTAGAYARLPLPSVHTLYVTSVRVPAASFRTRAFLSANVFYVLILVRSVDQSFERVSLPGIRVLSMEIA